MAHWNLLPLHWKAVFLLNNSMQLVDTHCHINFSEFKEDADAIAQESHKEGISLITVGSQRSTSERAVEWAEKYDHIYAAVGLHPTHLYEMSYGEGEESYHSRAEAFDYNVYKELGSHPKTVAIGEMGIDYFHLPESVPEKEVKAKQKEVFVKGLELSRELNKPMIIHTRPSTREGTDAFDDSLEVIKEVGYTNCVMHSFAGDTAMARKCLDMGLMLSFTGVITFKNAAVLQEAAAYAPLERVMVETDAPYLAPVPHRGKQNTPLYVKHVAEKLAELKGVSVEEVSNITTKNAQKFFNIDSIS